MAPEKAARTYRILFYLAVVAALVASFVAWRARQSQTVDVSLITKGRDRQFDFTVKNAYGFQYKGVSGSNVDDQVLLFGLYEKDRLFFMRDYLKNANLDNAIVIDAGANTGNHAFFLSRCAPRGKVHAFEPFAPAIKRFRDNLAINPEIKNIELHELGLSDKEGVLTFSAPPENDPGSGSFQTNRSKEPGHEREIKLNVVAGDTFLKGKESGPVALIKMDVEGHEEKALQGMKEILNRDRPVLIVEIGALPEGTIKTLDQLKAMFPENYEFLAFENDLEAVVNGKYVLQRLNDKVFSKLRSKLDVVAYPSEKAAAVPQP